MKTVNLIQGSPEWNAHRAQHWNASDAPAMLGISPYKSRARRELLRERATGIGQEFDADTQRRFDDGHRFEHLARAIAEELIGEELFPVTGVEGRYSASFDGLTMLEDTAFEHKTISDSLRAAIDPNNSINALPEHYRVQMEQQCMVSGAERVLFMASKWTDDGELIEERHCWYYPDAELRARIVAGWDQFERDLADYKPEAVETKPVGRSPETLPALRVEAKGMVTASNMDEFREHAMAVLGQINRDLQTDDDFATAESTVKWCSGVEDRLAAAKANVLAQMADVDAVCRTIDDVSAETRRIRLELDKLVKAEKENRKAQIVQAGVDAVRAHYAATSQTLGAYPSCLAFPASLPAEIGAAIKGLKTLTSIREKVDAAVATAKIAASQKADAIRVNAAILDEHKDHAFLFTDCVRIVAEKSADDLRNLVTARIAEHKAREEKKLEVERERIRAEEVARLAREQAEQASSAGAPEAQQPLHGSANNAGVATGSRNEPASESVTLGSLPTTLIPVSNRTVRLGEINAALAPLSITADGLASIGFASCDQDRAAKLYNAADLPLILRKLSVMLAATANRAEAA